MCHDYEISFNLFNSNDAIAVRLFSMKRSNNNKSDQNVSLLKFAPLDHLEPIRHFSPRFCRLLECGHALTGANYSSVDYCSFARL